MRGNEFLDKMELIDPAYVEAADAKLKKKKSVWVKWGAMAACICLVIAGAFIMQELWSAPNASDPGTSVTLMPVPNPDGTIRWEEVPETFPEHPILRPGDEGYIEPMPTPCPEEPYNGSAVNGPDHQEILNGKPMISHYGESSYSADKSVTDGGILVSVALQSAMEHYGEAANYRVLVELFSNGVQIPSAGELALKEAQRLSGLDYIVAMETYTEEVDHGEYVSAEVTYYFTLHATYEQLKNFPASGNLGYSIMLYDEYFDRTLYFDTQVYNGFAPADDR